MKAILLAAGKSTRTFPLTLARPKPLLKVGAKTILEHNLDALFGLIDEAIIVVGYKQKLIRKFLGNRYRGIKITYAEQKQQKGTGHALMAAKKHVNGQFLLLMGDDLYDKNDIRKCAKQQYALLATKVKKWQQFGVIVHKKNILVDFVEKPKTFISDLANTACYKLDEKIFYFLEHVRKSERGEIELPDAILAFSKLNDVTIVLTKNWKPIAFPWDVLLADQKMRKGKNIIGTNTKLKGKIANSSVGNNCIINGTIKNSLIMDDVVVGENSFIEDSILCDKVRFSGVIKSAKCISLVKGKKISVKKFGAAVGDKVLAKDVVISSGVKIWQNKKISGTITQDVL